jgi:hypothetical protein
MNNIYVCIIVITMSTNIVIVVVTMSIRSIYWGIQVQILFEP